ncbi:hypothetical protein MUK42_16713 [Musa troglodytarum]|uniref:Uncharacterized protein n=1 Tax=Musa troglodytarum TaxID=320322 RepID=A0A9E7H7B3_9LILI|nr:hypothetical protein MUK42_16713 [Musa troglodytarum]
MTCSQGVFFNGLTLPSPTTVTILTAAAVLPSSIIRARDGFGRRSHTTVARQQANSGPKRAASRAPDSRIAAAAASQLLRGAWSRRRLRLGVTVAKGMAILLPLDRWPTQKEAAGQRIRKGVAQARDFLGGVTQPRDTTAYAI